MLEAVVTLAATGVGLGIIVWLMLVLRQPSPVISPPVGDTSLYDLERWRSRVATRAFIAGAVSAIVLGIASIAALWWVNATLDDDTPETWTPATIQLAAINEFIRTHSIPVGVRLDATTTISGQCSLVRIDVRPRIDTALSTDTALFLVSSNSGIPSATELKPFDNAGGRCGG